MKRLCAFLLALALTAGMPASPAQAQVSSENVYATNSEFYRELSGEWYESSLKGCDGNKTTYANGEAKAVWQPDLVFSGVYRVSFWNVQHSGNTEKLKLEVKEKNGTKEIVIDHKETPSGYVVLGEFEFDAGTDGSITVYAQEGGFTRLSGVKYELLSMTGGAEGLVPQEGQEGEYPGYLTRSLPEKQVEITKPKLGAVTYYVAPGASGNGSEEAPFGTIEQAKSEVRRQIASGYPKEGIVVILKGGTYVLEKPLFFGQEDSGTEEAPVIWMAQPGEQVVFTTGKIIDHSNIGPVEDEDVLRRIPSSAREFVVQTNLADSQIPSLEPMDLRNSVPYVLMIGDQMGTLARWPNEGYGKAGDLVDSSSRPDSGPRKKGFTYEISDPRPLRWTQASDGWLNGFWLTAYSLDYAKIAALDPDKMEISGKDYNRWGSYGGARYFAENLLEEIDQPGEWYADTQENKLYFYPFDGWETQEITFTPKIFDIVLFSGCEHVVLQDVTLKAAGGNGVVFHPNSSNCGVIGATISHVAGAGAVINGKENYVRDCDIFQTGAQGISITGGDKYHLVPGYNYAENNSIHDVGTGGGDQKQGITVDGCASRVSHNHIYNILSHGIRGDGVENIIEYNRIERVNLELSDTGAIYYNNNGMGHGTKIRYNMIRDSVGIAAQQGYSNEGALGIYIDDLTSGIEAYGNVVINATEPGFFVNGGRENIIRNNIIINSNVPIRVVKTGNAGNVMRGSGIEANMRKYDIFNEPFTSKYPQIAKVFEDEYGEPKYNQVINNVTYNSGKIDCSAVESKGGVLEGNLQIDGLPETGIDDFTQFDYSQIKAQIPDFEELPFDQMGTYVGGARTAGETVRYDNRAEAFQLTYPADGEEHVSPDVTLKRMPGKGGIKEYTLFVAEDEAFEQIVAYHITSANSFFLSLDYGKTYYWRVKAKPFLGYDERWNDGGIGRFTTMNVEDVLKTEIYSSKLALDQSDSQSGRALLESAVAKADGAAAAQDQAAMKEAVQQLRQARQEFLAGILPDLDQLSTAVFDNYTQDTPGQRPLGLFLRSSTPLNIKAAPDPLDPKNQAIRFQDDHQQDHHGQRYFHSQEQYVEAGTSVYLDQTNGAFSISLMKTGVYPHENGVINNIAAKVVFASDGMIYGDKKKAYPIGPYEAGRWYDVKINLRLYDGTYDVFLNGEKKAEGIPLDDPTVTAVNQIVFDTSEGTSESGALRGVYYIDNTLVKTPQSPGRNFYLMDLTVNGEQVWGFEPGKTFYQIEASSSELKQAQIGYQAGKGAVVSVAKEEGSVFVSVISADQKNAITYQIRAK